MFDHGEGDRARMNGISILERFDAEMRIDPAPEAGIRFEAVGGVVRAVGHYACIGYSELSEASADRAIEEQVAYFTALGQEVEWKVYGHDRPRDLGARLSAHGFEAEEAETLMLFDLARDAPPTVPNAHIAIQRVRDDAGLRDLIAVSGEAFGRDSSKRADEFRARLDDPTLGLFVAYAGGVPVAAGRLEMPPGRSFAGLWGGATVPGFRGRGIYRALVAERAREARCSGYRYLRVDARDTSRPILERLGFVSLTTVTGWFLRPAAD
jgi:GNAT superfamily N-acetyltransferase